MSANTADDQELIKRTLEGQTIAFTELVNRYKDQLINYLSSYTPVIQDCEDIFQESFDKAYRSLNQYDKTYAFSTWLFTIARNVAIDHFRRNRNNISLPESFEPELTAWNSEQVGISPEDNMIKNQTFDEILKKIENLPQTYRSVAELRFIKEYAYEEIAAELNLPLNTVRTRIKRAKEKLNIEE